MNRYKIISAKGKGVWSEVWRKADAIFQEASTVELLRMGLIHPSYHCDNMCKMSSGKLIRDSVPRV